MPLVNISGKPEHKRKQLCSLICHKGHEVLLLSENFISTLMIE